MADPASYRPRDVPTSPGVYRFRDDSGRVLYVGKAKNLRNRLTQYFQDTERHSPRIARMVRTASSVQWTVVSTEVEALSLEYTWIKEYGPPFNIVFRDDKSYPYLAVTLGEEFPRVMVTRQARKPGDRYFGPYAHTWAIRETLDLLLRVYPVRSCTAGVFRRAAAQGRPCLLGYIDKCAAPCVGRISPEEHRALANSLVAFMAGRPGKVITRIEREMRDAAAAQDYERAARLRDNIEALKRVAERNAVVLPQGTDADIYGAALDELQVSVQVFYVRDGRVRGQRGWVADRDPEEPLGEILSRLLMQVYGESADVPREILVPATPTDAADLQPWLQARRGAAVSLRIPQRGQKKALAETVGENAAEALKADKLRRGSDLASRSRAIEDLAQNLGLATAPLRIECYDISHTQGTYQVGSMVVFEDGLPKKRDYRTFNVRGAEGEGERDDTAAIAEVLRRRFARRAGTVSETPESGEIVGDEPESSAFAYEPGLLLIDGGAPQVDAAQRALAEIGVDVPVVSLAKRLEEVWLPGEPFPVILPRGSESLHLLQRLRDEAHRFAISAHRKRRSKGMTASELQGLPGVGPVRLAELQRAFGTMARLRAATFDDLQNVPGFGPGTAARLYAALHPDQEGELPG